MDVLHIITTISRGGAENHLMDLIRHQVDAGFLVGVSWLKGTDYWRESLEKLDVQLFDLQIDNYMDFRAVLRLRKVITEKKPRLVHAHLPPAELCARIALINFSHVKFIITKHNDAPFYRGSRDDLLGRWVAARSQRMICISQAVADSVAKKRLGVNTEKIRCIRYGVDGELYRENRNEVVRRFRHAWGCDNRVVIFGCVARMVPQKDHLTLLRAFARILAAGRSAKLVLVGEGPMLEDIQKEGDRLGLGGALVFAGFIENMPAVMNAIDVLCLSSLYEGFGLVLIEAMAVGRPIIATRISSIPEIVLDGVTGLLVEKQDEQGLYLAMQRLMMPSLRKEMGQSGRRRTLGEFTLGAMFRKTDAVYTEVDVLPRKIRAAK
jgi:glycosyltransferase involved in cell wall biosynthesis